MQLFMYSGIIIDSQAFVPNLPRRKYNGQLHFVFFME